MRLELWQKTAVFAFLGLVSLSGLCWFILHDVATDDFSDVTPLLLTVHGVSSYALLVVVGSLLPLHVLAGWRSGRNFITGIAVTATLAALSATGLMLYYGGEETQAVAKWLHVAFGFGCFLLFPAHAFLKARRASSGSARLAETDGF